MTVNFKPTPLPVAPKPVSVQVPLKPAAPVAPVAAPAKPKPTALQGHVDFFDRNKDGIIKQEETKQGLRDIGLPKIFSGAAALAIHKGLTPTVPNSSDIDVSKIHTTKHDSDTDAFDAQGHHVASKMAGIMKHDVNHSGSLSWSELKTMIKANKETTTGAIAAVGEFGLLHVLGADTTEPGSKPGKTVKAVSRARLESVYDGTLFPNLAAERAAKLAK